MARKGPLAHQRIAGQQTIGWLRAFLASPAIVALPDGEIVYLGYSDAEHSRIVESEVRKEVKAALRRERARVGSRRRKRRAV